MDFEGFLTVETQDDNCYHLRNVDNEYVAENMNRAALEDLVQSAMMALGYKTWTID